MSCIYSWQREIWRRLALPGQTIGQQKNAGSASFCQALLLRGRKGLGKSTFATYLAKSRLCENPSVEREPCENCASCRWFEQGSHPDFRLVQPEALSVALATSGSSDDSWGDGGANAEVDAEPIGA